MKAEYSTPVPKIDPDVPRRGWLEMGAPRAALAVQWEPGEETAAIAEVTRAFDAVLARLSAAVVARAQAVGA